VDGDGTISLDEFKTMMERLMEMNEEDDRQQLQDTFDVRL
jgi:Ca2+-binding EF-hand superfamily protein